MKKPTRDVAVFGGLGVLAFAVLFCVEIYWLELAALLMGRARIVFDQQPSWIRGLHTAISWIPWAISFGLLVFAVVRRRWMPLVAFGGAQILGWATILAILFGGPVVKDHLSRVPFDSTRWKAENQQEEAKGVRVHMVDDLLRKHALVGMARPQVHELLGVPPATPQFSRYDYVYWLGQERGLIAIDSEWLALRFSSDRVVEAAVVRD